MVQNVFAQSPVDAANAKARSVIGTDRTPRAAAPQAPTAYDSATLASTYQVPENVIQAVAQTSGIQDPAELGQFSDMFAQRISGHLKSGMGMKDAMTATFGEGEDLQPILDLAVSLANGGGEAGAPVLPTDGDNWRAGVLEAQQGWSALTQVSPGIQKVQNAEGFGSIPRSNADADYNELQARELEAELPNMPDEESRAALQGEIASLRAIAADDRIGATTRSARNHQSGLDGAADLGRNQIQSGSRRIGELGQQIDKIPSDPRVAQVSQADGFVDALGKFMQAPGAITRSVLLRSLPAMAPSLVAGVAGTAVGGPAMGGMAGGGVGAATEYGMSVSQSLQDIFHKNEIDGTDEAAVTAFLDANPEVFDGVLKDAATRGGIIGATDAIGLGIAGTVARGASTASRAERVARIAAGAGIEGVSEGVGEALAQKATTGEIKAGDVLLETVAGLGMGLPQSAGQAIVQGSRAPRPAEPPTETEQTPPAPTGPTATLDQVLGTAEARFNELSAKANGNQAMDPETGEVIQAPGAQLTAEEAAERDFLGQNMSNPDVLAQAAGVTIIETPQAAPAVDPQSPAVDPSARAPAPVAPPAGPTARAAMAAGPRTRPDLRPDSKVRITIAGGNPVDAVFKSESNGNLNLEVNGEKSIISADMMASGQFTVAPVDALAEASKPEPTGLEDLGNIAGAMGGNLRDMLFGKVEAGETTENGAPSPILQMAKLIKDTGGTVTRNDIDAINALTDEVMALPVEKRKAAALEKAKGWTPAPTAEATAAAPAPPKPSKPRAPTLMKRPMTTQIKNVTGGIDPNGTVGLELKARGITPQTAPGLFRNGGLKDLDNLPVSEWQDYGAAVESDGNGYVSQQWIIDSIEAEARGEPVQNLDQQELQQIRNAELERDVFEGQEADGTTPVSAPATDAAPMDRFSYIDEASRQDMIAAEIASFESETGLTLTAEEKDFITVNFKETEYSVENSLYQFVQFRIERGDFDAQSQPVNDIPFGEDSDTGAAQADIQEQPTEGARPDQRPDDATAAQGGVNAASQDGERAGSQDSTEGPVASEQTQAGEQTLIDGVKPVTDRDRLEAQAKKPKRGGNAATDFGLFDTGARDQTDMFADGPATPATSATNVEATSDVAAENARLDAERDAVIDALTGQDAANRDKFFAAFGEERARTELRFVVRDGKRRDLGEFLEKATNLLDAADKGYPRPRSPNLGYSNEDVKDSDKFTTMAGKSASWRGMPTLAFGVLEIAPSMWINEYEYNIGNGGGGYGLFATSTFKTRDEALQSVLDQANNSLDTNKGEKGVTQARRELDEWVAKNFADAKPAAPAPQLQERWWSALIKARFAAKTIGMTKEEAGDAWIKKDALIAAVDARLKAIGFPDLMSPQAGQKGVEVAAPEYNAGEQAAIRKIKSVVKPDNREDYYLYSTSSADVSFSDLGDGDVGIIVTTFKTAYKGRVKETSEQTYQHRYSRLKQGLNAEAISAVDAFLADWNAADAAEQTATEAEAPRPKFGDPDYSLIDAMNDLMDMQAEQEANGMIGDSRLESRIERQRKLVKRMETEAEAVTVADAAAQADPTPTEGQKEAGNYQLGHARWNGLDLSIENEKGSTRSKKTPDGKTAWSVVMPAHYGYFKGTKGADGDHVDFYMGDVESSDYVMWIDQADAETGKFDEHKIMMGFTSRGAALAAYRGGFSDGRADDRIGNFFEGNVAQLKAWVESTSDSAFDAKKPVNGKLTFPFKKPSVLIAPAKTPAKTTRDLGIAGRYWDGLINSQQQSLIEKTEGKPAMSGVKWSKIGDDAQARLANAMPEARFESGNTAPAPAPSPQKGDSVLVKFESPTREDPATVLDGPFKHNSYGWAYQVKTSGYGSVIVPAARVRANTDPAPAPSGILSSLSQEKQDRAAELKKRLADKARNQTSSGLDPEYITLGGELVALYIEAGTKRFGQMLRDFAETTGLSMREAQAPMRAAYNHTRDEMDLDGQDVSDMDGADQVMAEVRKALAEADAPVSAPEPASAAAPAPRGNTLTDKVRMASQGDLVQHTTKRGKVLSGYILTGVTKADAKEIDEYTFNKDGGFFIRESDAAQYLAEAEDTAAQEPAAQPEPDATPKPDAPATVEPAIDGEIVDGVDFGNNRVSDRAQKLADRILSAFLDSARVQVVDKDIGKALSIISAIMDAQRMLEAEIGADLYQMVDRQIESAYNNRRDELNAAAKTGSTGLIAAPAAPDNRSDALRLVDHFADRMLAGEAYASIVSARKQAESVLGRPLAEADLKMIEEAIESGIVKAARAIVRQGKNAAATYDALVDLYQRQPKLAQRTSTSIEMQAYSTPAPMAFMASTMAGIVPDSTTTVYEPTAGTGMLLMNAEPANITANELQKSRMELLSGIYAGADLRNGDAMLDTPPRNVDVVIANPPFGKVKDADGTTKEWGFEGSTGSTTEIDHAISMRALSAMADNGRAVLIVGGHQGDADARKQSYRTPKRRAFWKKLYDNYNVTEHFTLNGSLYSRQGAGWPVDVVVIEGRSASQKALPMKEAPILYDTWDQLKGRVDGRLDSLDPRGGRTADSDGAVQTPQGGLDGGSLSGRPATPVQNDGASGTQVGQRPVSGGANADATVGRPRPAADGGSAGNAGGIRNTANTASNAPVSDSSSANQEQSGQPATDQGNDLFGTGNGNLPNSVTPAVKKAERNNTETETDYQVQYAPRSNARFAVGTLVPKNVASAVGQALSDLADRVGDIDAYVAKELGYTLDEMLGTAKKPGAFSAEQVDAIALAISNVSEGAGFIIGDQTGVGKGRIVAGMIRYALRQGKTPVFFTVKPGLYGDMMRDLRDIGSGDLLPAVMVTNDGLRAGQAVPISSKAGDVIASGSPAEQKVAIRHMINNNALPDGKRVLFTTYDQMNTVKGVATDRMRALMAIADNAMFILDESHEAGGSPAAGRGPANAPEPRSKFMRKMLAESPNGKMFSSATFAKNSTVMSLYSSTNMKNALASEAKLIDAVERGGDALLQVISSGLVQDGQYVRRERTYEGISMSMDVLDSDPISAENGAMAVREIFTLDQQFMEPTRDAFVESVSEEGGGGASDNAIGEKGASSTNFSSTMHNVVSQLLLSIKAKEVADKAIQLHRDGKKPIIALSNTNASIIEDYVRDRDLSLGDTVNVPFNEILRRYLQRLRRITIKDEDGNKTHHFMTDAEIIEFGGGVALDQMRATERLIDELDLGDLPGSPIDYIRDRMEAEGVKVGEITGRGKIIENGILATRKGGQAENKRIMNRYNAGGLNALIINRSGATGFSMHATDKADNDGKVRAMLILQPDNNIDIFMQMLGRINRTGQIVLPEYYITVSDLAVEKRPAALLMKKLASLNASTTANKKSAVMMDDAPDFMNKYGDKVIQQYLRDNPEVSMATGVAPPANDSLAGIAAKLTGKLIIMGPKRTEEIYEEIEAAYSSYIEELNSLGTNDLEAQVLEVGAKTENSEVIEAGIATNSAFGQDTILETVSMKVIGKPYTSAKLAELVAEKLDGKTPAEYAADQAKLLNEMFNDHTDGDKARRDGLVQRSKDAKTDKQKDNAADMIRRHDVAVTDAQDRFREIKDRIVRQFAPGKPMMVRFLKNGDTVDVVYGKSLGVDLSRLKGNPTAASRISVKIALASAARQITRSLSSTMDKSSDADISFENARDETVDKAFDGGQADARETREMITGNVINGFAKFGGKGQIVFFRRDNGELAQGLLMPKEFDAIKAMESQPKIFRTIDQAVRFVETAGNDNAPAILKTADEVMTVQRKENGVFLLSIERKRGHKPYILNKTVIELLGEFSSRSGPFKKYVRGRDQLASVLAEYEASIGAEFQAPAFKDEAQAIIDADNPKPAGGTLSAKVQRGTPKPMSFADRLKKLDNNSVTQLNRDLRAELKKVGIDHRITLDLRPDAFEFTGMDPMDGYFLDTVFGRGQIGVSAAATDGAIGVMRHEIIHALRRPEMWGGTHGLFTAAEWKTLVTAARKQTRLRAEIDANYPNLPESGKLEEIIAEMFMEWSADQDQMGATPAVKTVLARISDMITAIVAALRGSKANEAARVFESIRSGELGGRDPQGPSGGSPSSTLQAKKKSGPRGFDGAPSVFSPNYKEGSKGLVSNVLTQAMSGRANLLALVPGRPLLEELGRNLPSAKSYLDIKMAMDSLRNEMHAKTDEVAQAWRKILTANKAQNRKMMDLMHDTTIAGVDPSKPFMGIIEQRDPDIMRIYKKDTVQYKEAAARKAKHERNKAAYDDLKPRYDALPASFQRMFNTVRDSYSDMANEFEKAVEENANKAMTVSVRRAERAFDRKVEQFRDDGLTGQELQDATDEARRELETAKAQKQWSKMARLQQLRQKFEANRVEGPYFPLSRFGDFFATVRDENGKVVSFSQFERVADQKAYAAEMRKDGMNVETGVMKDMQARETVDPNFVADVEALLEGISADSMVMDAIWQQWLMTLPDQSMRRNRIHRKGTSGYDADAFRAFGKQMFHGAHQLARLKHSLDLSEALDEMQVQSRTAADPDRAGLVVKEINKRHEYTMNPSGSAWSQAVTSAAFIYYLGVTPAAAIVNLTQTTVVGIPMLGAFYGKGGTKVAARELARAMADFTSGLNQSDPVNSRGTMTSARLTAEEKAAMQAGYDSGFIDKTQSHDLAGVGETGVEYSPVRTKVMGHIAFFFHHAERTNREVTFLAAYRMAKAKGMGHEQATEKAGSLTFKTHFDYQNTSRPRLMHDDYIRAALVFRNFQLNMIWRLVRDTHQTFNGESPALKAEARSQLLGITAQMLLHAGVKGVWGYAILMTIAGMFFGGGEDEAEEALEKTLLAFLPRDAVGMLLNGIPGHLTGVDLRSRIGMPELWFRSPDRDLEGSDSYYYWLSQLLGAIPEMGHRVVRGVGQVGEGFGNGDFWGVMRGIETASPKFLRDILKSGRFAMKGAETFNGDPILEELRTGELIGQIIGFAPARLSERYDTNRRLKNAEARILNERSAVMGAIAKQIMDGKPISASSQARWDAYNRENPDYPITPSSLRQSVRGRAMSSLRNEFGVQINPRLNDRLRENAVPPISR